MIESYFREWTRYRKYHILFRDRIIASEYHISASERAMRGVVDGPSRGEAGPEGEQL